MTTIATDGKVMACDGLVVDGDTIVDRTASKIRRLYSGDIIGAAGRLSDLAVFTRWLNDGAKGKPDVWEQSEALVLQVDGGVYWINSSGLSAVAPSVAAIGSGMVYALAAMDAGADPRTAVEIACYRDPRSGGTILIVEPTRPCKGRV